MPVTPTLLLILDGFGLAPAGPGNAVSLAKTPVLDGLFARYPHTQLACAGRAVGLPDGFMGNSEVGHMNIGAGRIVYQDMTRIDISIEDGSFARNPVLLDLCAKARAGSGRLHLMGLVSDGGVHSHQNHIHALVRLAKDQGLTDILHPRLSRWPRHAALKRPGLRPGPGGHACGDRRGQGGHGDRPLLCHGPRQAF